MGRIAKAFKSGTGFISYHGGMIAKRTGLNKVRLRKPRSQAIKKDKYGVDIGSYRFVRPRS